MASLAEQIRVNRSHGVRNTMTDYGNARFYEIDEYEEQRDRIKVKIARLRRQFEACCRCGHNDQAGIVAIDLAYWQSKLTNLAKRIAY